MTPPPRSQQPIHKQDLFKKTLNYEVNWLPAKIPKMPRAQIPVVMSGDAWPVAWQIVPLAVAGEVAAEVELPPLPLPLHQSGWA